MVKLQGSWDDGRVEQHASECVGFSGEGWSSCGRTVNRQSGWDINDKGHTTEIVCPLSFNLAGVQGFEPQLTDPESAVLPLDDTPSSRSKKVVPPILFCVRHLSLPENGRRFLTCWLLANVAVAAAMRANEVVVTRQYLAVLLAATNEPAPHTLLSHQSAQSPSRRCRHRRWWSLTPPVSVLTRASGSEEP